MTEPLVRRIQVCLNGGRSAADHPAVPITPAQLAVSSQDAVAAGADAIHLHPRRADGQESLAYADISAAVHAVRSACPGTPIGVTTGLWITDGDAAARLRLIRGWIDADPDGLPDYASVNLSEPGFDDLTDILHSAGVAVEAGVWSLADADRLGRSRHAQDVLRILVEVIDFPADTCEAEADAILDRLRAYALRPPVLLHGENSSAWPLIGRAGRLGLATRIGLEDALAGPDGDPVRDNADLVRVALAQLSR
ncbi:uncharacterized protein (DUF849 family) [Hamadaea flava]|uniref:3-keto-5-aminohexanoate cleavage protein n=1 Tax=Hamadaea flava TaxID=1742688 RepID=A0ABV8LVK6_9ACTN|nr:3-keto-5-aminohexanoate cleavage protein [Hamadaea flava]MCP2329132.1 uncharacterized protein (DUF849 family) [Hamadaea flava]